MLYKKRLNRLCKENGIIYSDLDQVSSAIDTCTNTIEDLYNVLDSIGCYHNHILDDLKKVGVINDEIYNKYHNERTCFRLLTKLLNYIYISRSEKSFSKEESDTIYSVENELLNLREGRKNDITRENLSKQENLSKRVIYKDLNEQKKTLKALTYAKRKLER